MWKRQVNLSCSKGRIGRVDAFSWVRTGGAKKGLAKRTTSQRKKIGKVDGSGDETARYKGIQGA
jgi:hypothetical protein